MKILRLRLRDFKGVADREVTFAPDGVTIVEGPNEVGKTSLAEGLTLVLEHLDSSSRAEIRDAKPVHRDAGPWVEAELTTGDYHVIIEKRWLRAPMTHLRVLAPRAEELTGREAHERLRAILDETLDQQLFSALHYLQGVDISQAAVGGSLSLAAALDASASGQSPAAQADAGIVDRVRQERARYFTPGGKATAERIQRAASVDRLREDADAAAARIRELDDLAERFRSLSDERRRLDDERTTAERLLAAETRAWQAVQEARRTVSEATLRHDGARAATAEAERRLLARAELRTAETDAAARTAASARRVEALCPGADAAAVALADATTAREAARAARAVATSALRGAREDHEYARRLVSRDLWAERLARVRAGQQTLAATAELIGGNRLDAERLALLEAAASAVTTARAQLSAASAGVTVTALRDATITIGDDAHHINTGGVLEAHVDGTLVIGVGDLARISVAGGAPERSLRDALDGAEHEFVSLLVDSGLPASASIAACRIAAQARRDALAQQAEARRLIEESLRDLTVERLEQEVADDEEYLRAYVARHGVVDPAPEVDATKADLDRAEMTASTAVSADDEASAAYDAAHAHRDEVQRALTDTQTDHHVAVALHRSATDALELARADLDDDALARTAIEARQAETAAADALDGCRRRPGGARSRLGRGASHQPRRTGRAGDRRDQPAPAGAGGNPDRTGHPRGRGAARPAGGPRDALVPAIG